MRYPIFNRYRHYVAIVGGLVFLGLQIVAACAEDPSRNAVVPESETSSANFTIHWHDAPQMQPSNGIGVMAALNCGAAEVDQVFCDVYDENDNLLVTGGPWPCSAGSGVVDAIPAGRDRTFVALAKAEDEDDFLYQGETSRIRIRQDEVSNIVVDAYPFRPNLTSPEDGSEEDPAGFIFEWEPLENADQYEIQVADNESFQDAVIGTSAVNSYIARELEASKTYHWKVQPFDRFGNPGRESVVGNFTTTNCTYAISDPDNTISQEGGDGQFTVTPTPLTCQWVAALSQDADWIQITTGTEEVVGIGRVEYSVVANNTPTTREGTITVGTQEHTISQAGLDCSYTISPEGPVEFNAEGGTGTIQVTTGEDCPWSATEAADWIDIPAGETVTGNGTVSYTVSENDTGDTRTADITVGEAPNTVTLRVTQTASVDPPVECTYTVAPTAIAFDEWGGSTNQNCTNGTCTITITTQEECAVTPTPSDPWIILGTVSDVSSGVYNLTFTVEENPDLTVRSGTIDISGAATCRIAQIGERSTIELETNREGSDFQTIPNVENYRSCVEECIAVTECMAWTYVTDSQNCYLKDTVPDPTDEEGQISGVIHGRE